MLRNILSWHVNRSMYEGRPETLTTHDINIVLFNRVRINPMWLNYEDERTAHIFIGWIPGGGYCHVSWLSLELWPRFQFQSDVTRAIWLWMRRVWYWREIRQLERKMEATAQLADDICSDPMNGCPGDFREDFDRKLRYMEHELITLQRGW